MSSNKSEAGFTLIELLVATAVMGLLSATLMMMMEQINQTMVDREARSTQMVNMHVTSVSFEAQIRRLFLPGIVGDPAGHGWRFKGGQGNYSFDDFGDNTPYEDIGCDPDGVDHLASFESLLERQVNVSDPSASSDRRSTFIFQVSDESAVVRECALRVRNTGHDGDDMEWGNTFPSFDDNTDDLHGDLIGDNIDIVIMRFYDPTEEEWVEDWDSTEDMPDAIEYAFRTFNPEGHVGPRWFRGTVSISSAN